MPQQNKKVMQFGGSWINLLQAEQLLVPLGLAATSFYMKKGEKPQDLSQIRQAILPTNPIPQQKPKNDWIFVVNDAPPNSQKGGNLLQKMVLPATLLSSSILLKNLQQTKKPKNNIAFKTTQVSNEKLGLKTPQHGGGGGEILNLSDLILTTGLTFGSKWLQKRTMTSNALAVVHSKRGGSKKNGSKKKSSKKKSSKKNQKGGTSLHPGIPALKDGLLSHYLAKIGAVILTPQTLVPLSLLLVLHLANKQLKGQSSKLNTEKNLKEMEKMVDMDDLEKYLNRNGIDEVKLDTQFPFAYVMGRDMFKDSVHNA